MFWIGFATGAWSLLFLAGLADIAVSMWHRYKGADL